MRKQAQGLLSGKVIALKGLKSKAGKKYDAEAILVDGKVKLIFVSTKDKNMILRLTIAPLFARPTPAPIFTPP